MTKKSLKDYANEKTDNGHLIIDGMISLANDESLAGNVRQMALTKLSEITDGKPLSMSSETKQPMKIEELTKMFTKLVSLVGVIKEDMEGL